MKCICSEPIRCSGWVCFLFFFKKKKPSKFTFQFNSARSRGCVRYTQTQTGGVCRGHGPISRRACGAAPSNHSSLTLNVISSHQPQGDGPIEIPLQLPSWQSLSKLPASVVSKGPPPAPPLTRQSETSGGRRRLGWDVARGSFSADWYDFVLAGGEEGGRSWKFKLIPAYVLGLLTVCRSGSQPQSRCFGVSYRWDCAVITQTQEHLALMFFSSTTCVNYEYFKRLAGVPGEPGIKRWEFYFVSLNKMQKLLHYGNSTPV